jgi:hypothetical protein
VKAEFREHFKNITRVMDCVSCDKCKLWGKLQVSLSFLNKILVFILSLKVLSGQIFESA